MPSFTYRADGEWAAHKDAEMQRYLNRLTNVLPGTLSRDCLQCLVREMAQGAAYTLCHVPTRRAFNGFRLGDMATFYHVVAESPAIDVKESIFVRLDEFHQGRPETDAAEAVAAVESLLRANDATRTGPADRDMRETMIEALRILADEL